MPRSNRSAGAGDSGSAPIDFIAFGLPLVLLILVASQLLFSSYLANAALDAAGEGAQSLAYSDGTEESAQLRIAKVLGWLAPQAKSEAVLSRQSQEGVSLAAITVRVTSPLLTWAGQPIEESASVIDETN